MVVNAKMANGVGKRRKVIFVGGASYSGTTLLDMLLSNTDEGFSCGELIALFHPHKTHHIAYTCGCGQRSCAVWPDAIKEGPERVYARLFQAHPQLSYIVDSSKDPQWLQRQSRALAAQGIDTEHVLIWKTPEAFRASWAKRGRERTWRRAWEHYHVVYGSLMENWYGVPYEALTANVDMLATLVATLGIAGRSGQERYWEKVHHTLFGNSSAKIHLYGAESANYQECIADMADNQRTSEAAVRHAPDSLHRSIYSQANQGTANAAGEAGHGGSTEDEILHMLAEHDFRRGRGVLHAPAQFSLPDRASVPLLRLWWSTRRRVHSAKTHLQYWMKGA